MKYKTHKRYGQVVGVGMIPVAASTGLMEVNVEATGFNGMSMTVLGIVLMSALGYMSSVFGSGFPDLDCPGSTPARKHRILAMIFKVMGVKHRGKFSHDLLSQSLLWFAMYGLVVHYGGGMAVTNFDMFLVDTVALMVVFSYAGVVSHLFADALTADGVWVAWKFKVRLTPVFIRKFGIGNFKPFKRWFTTESMWNDFNYKVMTGVLPVVSVVALITTVQQVF